MSNEDSRALDAGIREIFARGDVGQHPSSEELAAYARGELAAAQAERLQEHLGPCRKCTAAVLALEFPRLEAATADRVPDAEVAAGVEAIVSRTRPGASRSRTLLAVAAMLAVACLSLALLAVKLQRQVGELDDALQRVRTVSTLPAPGRLATLPPQTNVPIVDLYPSSVARSEAPEPRPIRLPHDAAMVTLILTPPSGLSHDAYALRILDAAGVELWRGPARPGAAAAFVMVLPRRFAEAGADRIELYGIDGRSDRLLETYRVRFELRGGAARDGS